MHSLWLIEKDVMLIWIDEIAGSISSYHSVRNKENKTTAYCLLRLLTLHLLNTEHDGQITVCQWLAFVSYK
jgi:hypothetical protein